VDTPQDKLLTTLPYLLRVHVLLQELIVIAHSIHILTEIAKQIVEEEVEGPQEVAVVLDFFDNTAVGHPILD